MFLGLLAAVWGLWSGHTEPLILAFGAGSVAFTALIAARMDAIDAEGVVPLGFAVRSVPYMGWLLTEIVKSNLHVASVILNPDLPIQPQLVRVHTTQRTDLGHVLHANSITITPGTVSLDVRDGTILVHALTQDTAAGATSGDMDKRVSAVEGAG